MANGRTLALTLPLLIILASASAVPLLSEGVVRSPEAEGQGQDRLARSPTAEEESTAGRRHRPEGPQPLVSPPPEKEEESDDPEMDPEVEPEAPYWTRPDRMERVVHAEPLNSVVSIGKFERDFCERKLSKNCSVTDLGI